MKRGDLIFFYPKRFNLTDKLISIYGGKYVHTGILLSSELVLSMGFSGVSIREVASYERKYDIYKIDTDTFRKEQLIKFLLSKMYSCRYDFLGLLNFVFSFIPNVSRRFFCSEFISWGLFYIGLLPERLNLSPVELANQEFLRFNGDYDGEN
ncbi:MAG TPA: hypothetical protein P5150_09525 [Candidatus Ratteibacteria bacterium]|nr:hypothetical protein [Candidatus Ratteibacteria bacterium]